MFKVRQTWNDIFPNRRLYAIDVRVNLLDPAWPITAQPPVEASIHVNPKFLSQKVGFVDSSSTACIYAYIICNLFQDRVFHIQVFAEPSILSG